ncbi:MAG: hypothetical protein ABI550_01380 [Ignavibacteriaceae bacterium]
MKNIKKINKYLISFALAVFLYGCDKPAPTELIDSRQEDQIEYEIIAKDPTDEFYSNGTDTSGTENLTRFTNVISVSGVKISDKSQTVNLSTAQAIFFDKNKPVKSPFGNIIGYQTFILGEVKFNNKRANLAPFRIKFRKGDRNSADTTLGFQHILYSGRNNNIDPFDYQYSSDVSFELNPLLGQSVSFSIPTPPEIFANVKVTGKQSNKNLAVHLEWNRGVDFPLEIIVGGRLKGSDKIISIYRLRTKDDGSLFIPAKFFNEIPLGSYNGLVFSLIRKYQSTISERNSELVVLSQSIHSIVVEFP